MRSLVRQIIGLLVLSLAVGLQARAQHTYYVSSSIGSDSYSDTQAQSKSSPWAHVPGMVVASGNAAAYTPVAGDSFVFMGCDTWTASGSVFVNVSHSGSSGNRINYGGLDHNWYNT